MNRRLLLPLAAATGLLAAGSLIPRLGSITIDPRVVGWFTNSLAMIRSRDVMPLAGIAAAVLLAMALIAMVRSRRNRPISLGLDFPLASREPLPATAGLSRRVAVAHLAESGRSIPAIARETRLGQDAVRGLVQHR